MNRRTGLAGTCSLLAGMLALTLTACAPAPTPQPPSPAEPTSSAEPTTTEQPDPVALVDLRVDLEPVVRGLEQPVYLTHAGDGSGRLFVVEQAGRIRVVRDGVISPGSFLDVSSRITSGGERGLLGLAFAPDYASTGIFYVNYTDPNGDTVVARYTAADPASDAPELDRPETILAVEQPYANHNGGCLVFEPGTSRLWVGMGDGGAAGDPNGNAQNPRALLGKMLVLDVGGSGEPEPEIVQTGVRNPWRFSFDRESRDLWIGDVGQNEWEEIDFVELADADGVDWGWDLWEGSHPYPAGSNPKRSGHRFPIAEYDHGKGGSVTGGYVYRGSAYPAMRGAYLYGDFSAGWIAGIRRTAPDGSVLETPEERDLIEGGRVVPSSFGEDEAGELYVVDYTGSVWQITGELR